MNYFVKTPKILHAFYKDAVWFLPNPHNTIYLTFDDGPIPGVTDKCLAVLNEYQVKATFFCVGQNAQNNLELINRIIKEGHAIGNHTQNHLKGWKTENDTYVKNVERCNDFVNSKLFRPPYGKAKRSQLKMLANDYKIVMWDVLSGDFDPKVSVEKAIENVVNNTEAGSIIVMHDNEKCGDKMLEILPKVITELLDKGFNFQVIK